MFEPMQLWIPARPESTEESIQLIQSNTLANDAVMSFCDGKISLDTTLEMLEQHGVDIDQYRDALVEAVRRLGA